MVMYFVLQMLLSMVADSLSSCFYPFLNNLGRGPCIRAEAWTAVLGQ